MRTLVIGLCLMLGVGLSGVAVSDGPDARPDPCDKRLFGVWYCNIACLYDDCEADGGTYTLSRSIDPDGYERIHQQLVYPEGDTFLSEWRVARQWGPTVGDDPVEKGKLVAVSCNGKTDAGYSNLSVNLKNPDGSDRHLYKYWVDEANRILWQEFYDVRWEGDTMHKRIYGQHKCYRELKRPSP